MLKMFPQLNKDVSRSVENLRALIQDTIQNRRRTLQRKIPGPKKRGRPVNPNKAGARMSDGARSDRWTQDWLTGVEQGKVQAIAYISGVERNSLMDSSQFYKLARAFPHCACTHCRRNYMTLFFDLSPFHYVLEHILSLALPCREIGHSNWYRHIFWADRDRALNRTEL